MATWRVVCLLHSRRRTFLFSICLHLPGGYPILPTEGYPIPGPDRGTPSHTCTGGYLHPRHGWVPQGTPHPDLGWGNPPLPTWTWDGVTPPSVRRQISIATTCYAAGGMPLAFTQEDFLVVPVVLGCYGCEDVRWSVRRCNRDGTGQSGPAQVRDGGE